MAAPILSVSYSLQPPSATTAPPNLSPAMTHDFSLPVKSSESKAETGSEAHYEALRDAIAQAKDVTGGELTKWRDAVGDSEKEKAGGKVAVDEEADEEIEEE
jgi:hypothetical protein